MNTPSRASFPPCQFQNHRLRRENDTLACIDVNLKPFRFIFLTHQAQVSRRYSGNLLTLMLYMHNTTVLTAISLL